MPPKKPKHQTHLASLNSARKTTKPPAAPASTPKTATKQTNLFDFRFHSAPKPPPPHKPPPTKRRRGGAGKLQEQEELEIPETQLDPRDNADAQIRREAQEGSETESEVEDVQQVGDGGAGNETESCESESGLEDEGVRLKPLWTPKKKKIPATAVIPETPEMARVRGWREGSPTPRGKRRRTVSPIPRRVEERNGGRNRTPVRRGAGGRGAALLRGAPRSAAARINLDRMVAAEPEHGREMQHSTASSTAPRLRGEAELEGEMEMEDESENSSGQPEEQMEKMEEPPEERYPRDRVIPSSQWWEREGSLSEDEEKAAPAAGPQVQSDVPTPEPRPSPSAEEATRAFAALETSPLEEHAPIPSTQPEKDVVMADSAPAASRPPLLPGSSTMSYFETQAPETQAPETEASALFSFPPPSPPPPNAAEPMRPPLLPGSSTMSYPDTQAPETTPQNAQRSRPVQSSAPPLTQPFSPPPRIKPEPESQTETQYPTFPFNPIHTQVSSQIPMSSQPHPTPPSPSPSFSPPSPSPSTPPPRIKREPSSPSPLRVKLEPETQVPEFPFNPVHTQYPDFPCSSQAPSSSQQEGWRSPVYTPAQTIGRGGELTDSQLLPDELMATFPMPSEWEGVDEEELEGSPTQ